jgi:hypothetical protein
MSRRMGVGAFFPRGASMKTKPLPANATHPYRIGADYFIRTVTHHYTGKLVAMFPQELLLENAAWIADDGRFAQAVATGSFSEVEPFPPGSQVIIGRGSILDAVAVSFPIPKEQK